MDSGGHNSSKYKFNRIPYVAPMCPTGSRNDEFMRSRSRHGKGVILGKGVPFLNYRDFLLSAVQNG